MKQFSTRILVRSTELSSASTFVSDVSGPVFGNAAAVDAFVVKLCLSVPESSRLIGCPRFCARPLDVPNFVLAALVVLIGVGDVRGVDIILLCSFLYVTLSALAASCSYYF